MTHLVNERVIVAQRLGNFVEVAVIQQSLRRPENGLAEGGGSVNVMEN